MWGVRQKATAQVEARYWQLLAVDRRVRLGWNCTLVREWAEVFQAIVVQLPRGVDIPVVNRGTSCGRIE